MLDKETFANPPCQYRPVPFWFWNSRMRKDRIEEQIRDFHAKGIGGFFVHARVGLETEYLSDEWMDCIRHAVIIAHELGMEVWLYDENGFPSGIGNLKVSRVPEYRSKFIDVTEAEAESGEEVVLDLPSGEVLMAHACSHHDAAGQRIDLAGHISGQRLVWTAPPGSWNLAIYSKRMLEDPNDVVFGVDYLNPEAMRCYLNYTLTPYERALGEHFGKTIKGIFADEPTLLPWHHDIDWYGRRSHTRVVVWDDLIEREMVSRVRLDARAFLPHLFFQIDENTPQVRRAFWQVVSDLYIRAFFGPYGRWCEDHNLKLTGHVLFEEGLYLNTDFQADIAASLSMLHIPGTDHLGEVTEFPYGGFANTPRHLTNLQGEKLVTSIAHHQGRDAAITETYGCAGWGLSFEKMKWIVDWQYSLGLNMLCPHAVFHSIEGFRKSDAPPSENHMAGWKHYRRFADYIGRLSYALREGRHVAKVALFYPLSEFWGQHTIGKEGESDRVTSDAFDLCASILPRLHFDYDIITEQVLSAARVEDGKLTVRDETYDALIAPPSVTEGKAREVVARFISSGGNWLLPPIDSVEPRREHIESEFRQIRSAIGRQPASGDPYESEAPWSATQRHVTSGVGRGKLMAVLAGTQDAEGVANGLDAALREALTPDVEIRADDGGELPDVRYVHRESGGKHVLFLINSSELPTSAVTSCEVTGSVEEWNPETGETCPVNGPELVEGRLRLRHDFPPYGSMIYVIDPARPVQLGPRVESQRVELLTLPDNWRFTTEGPNALILGRWQFGPRVHGGGEDYTYNATFDCRHLPDKLMLMLDDIEYRTALMGGMDLTVQVNDRSWRRPKFEWHLDPGLKTLDISEAVKLGANQVSIVIRHSSWSGQPHLLNAPPALLGAFACDRDTLTLLPPVTRASSGSWTEYGYPCYSGTAAYSQSFSVPRLADGARLIATVDSVRDMVEIVVNGTTAAVRLWQPWEADVTDLTREGENEIEIRVTNSMANFIEGDAKPSGLMGRVRLIAENR